MKEPKEHTVVFRKITEEEVLVKDNDLSDVMQRRRKEGWQPEAINDQSIIGTCESCHRPIVKGMRYASDPDGVLVCGKCCNFERSQK